MRILNYILILLILMVSVNANHIEEIQNKALELKGYDNVETYYNINNWVENNIKYEVYYHPRGVELTWKTMIGDCTDKSMIKKQMLDYHNITNRIVHGYVNDYEKHDWNEVDLEQYAYRLVINNETINIYDKELAIWLKERLGGVLYPANYGWNSIEYLPGFWNKITKRGNGVW
jgi:hypothetical protein